MTIDYAGHVRADSARLADVLARMPFDAAVPSCPGWTLRDLAHHLGGVHRWARVAAATGRRPAAGEVDGPPPDDQLATWLLAGASDLADTLETVDPDAPTWHPFPVARRGAVRPRRQAHETAVHRWDAEAAAGTPAPIEPALAADGIGEYAEVILPRVVTRDGIEPPPAIVVELRDVALVWELSAGAVTPVGSERAVDVSARAADVVLALWGRAPAPAGSPLAAAWFALGGN